jgi:long-chain acyl-CoA synthetase
MTTYLQPLSTHRHVPVGSADVLPSVAAVRWPHRAALRTGTSTVTFAELDHAISRLAFGLRQRLGGDGLTVAVSSVLGLDFPTAFYGIIRSGNVAAPVNPRMPAEAFARLLAETDARAVVLGRAMYERVRPVLSRRLELVLLLDAPVGPGVLTCAELSTGGALLVEPRDRAENEPAAIMLGAGRAGHVRTAHLTHHELKAQAVGAAMGLAEDAVVLNALPAFGPAHLGAGLYSGATQVLMSTPDPAAAAREAERQHASHLLTDDGETHLGHRLLAAS